VFKCSSQCSRIENQFKLVHRKFSLLQTQAVIVSKHGKVQKSCRRRAAAVRVLQNDARAHVVFVHVGHYLLSSWKQRNQTQTHWKDVISHRFCWSASVNFAMRQAVFSILARKWPPRQSEADIQDMRDSSLWVEWRRPQPADFINWDRKPGIHTHSGETSVFYNSIRKPNLSLSRSL